VLSRPGKTCRRRGRGVFVRTKGVEDPVAEIDDPDREEEGGEDGRVCSGRGGGEQQGPTQRDEGGVETEEGWQEQEVSEDGDGFLPNPAMPA
jgi:hypothetical protein